MNELLDRRVDRVRNRPGWEVSIAGELARFVTSTSVNDLPPLALERARMVIASTIASAAMGADIVSSRIIRELARERAEARRRRPSGSTAGAGCPSRTRRG